MPILAVAPWEVRLTDREIEIGLRRTTIINSNDSLAEPFFSHYNNTDDRPMPDEDKVLLANGVANNRAHNPREALLGPCDNDGRPTGELGYFAADQDIARTLTEHFTVAPVKALALTL